MTVNARIWLGKDKVQAIDCTIEDQTITVNVGGGAHQFRWDPANIGLAPDLCKAATPRLE